LREEKDLDLFRRLFAAPLSEADDTMFKRWKASFKIKLLLGISVIILFTFCTTGIVSYRIHLALFEDEVSGQYQKANEQAMAQFELRIQELYRISNYIVFNKTIEEIVTALSTKESVSASDQYFEQDRIQTELRQVKFDAPQVLSMYLFDLKGTNYYYGLMQESVEQIDQDIFQELREEVQKSNGEMVWMKKKLASRIEKSGYRDVIIASRWMRNNSLGMYGMLVMVIDENFMTRSFREIIGNDNNGHVYLFDRHAAMLYTNDFNQLAVDTNKLLSMEDGSTQNVNGTPYYFSKHFSPDISFTLVSGISMADFMKKSQLILKISIYSGILSIFLSAMLIFLLSQRLLRPLRELVFAMRKMRQGLFDTRIEHQSNDELGFIAESFNSMASNVSSLIKEVYLRQISEREAELKALQSQLNPHFLYNTLNGLYWKLYLQNDRDTANLVSSLSDLLKYSLARVRKQTTLREEMEQIRNYVTIQEAFIESGFDAVIHMDEEVADCLTLRLFLQPIVENVFVHAFREQDTPKILLIKAYRFDHYLKIEISDNGCGMTKEEIERIFAEEPLTDRVPLGVRSVIRRIDLIYGSPYRLDLTSESGDGTTVHLYLPFEKALDHKEVNA
jgi:two-component system sensor histidine kinase YesM